MKRLCVPISDIGILDIEAAGTYLYSPPDCFDTKLPTDSESVCITVDCSDTKLPTDSSSVSTSPTGFESFSVNTTVDCYNTIPEAII